MDHLLECAEAFEQLLDVQYHIVLGRKNRLTELTLRFDPTEFNHLVGLHKLRDLRLARGNRETIFHQILSKTICMEDIKKSRYFPEIQDHMCFFDKIEYLLDSNKTIFRYNEKLQTFSMIEAEYLLSTPYKEMDIYIFLDRNIEQGHFFCRSFFQKGEKDYTKGQAVYTLLKKEKTIVSTGKTVVQYDRLMLRKT